MKGTKNFWTERGAMLMLCGFAVALAGTIAYIYFNQSGNRIRYLSLHLDKIALAVSFVGFAAYFVSRVGMALARRQNQYRTFASDDDIYTDDDGDKEYVKARNVGGVKIAKDEDDEFVLPMAKQAGGEAAVSESTSKDDN